MPKVDDLTFQPMGDFGIEVASDGEHIHVRIPRSTASARPSSTGKMKLTGSTGGWQNVPNTDIRLSVMAGVKV